MQESAGSPLAAWESYYVIIGSSAAALTGLQFVVIALLAETRKRSTTKEIEAFATPTIVHFAAVLLLSAIVSAPWPALTGARLSLGICGCVGVGYAAVVIRRARRQTGYRLVLEDWLWHTVLPVIAYTTLLAAALALRRYTVASLFAVGAAALLLLFIGIHNAWDTVTYIALNRVQAGDEPRDRSQPATTADAGGAEDQF
jgi:hypothetical protein